MMKPAILAYDICNEQDIRSDGEENKLNSGYAKNYISGTSIRGMLIGKYLKKNPGINLSQDEFSRKIFLDGGVKFLNAYKTSYAGIRTVPIPENSERSNENLKFGIIDYRNNSCLETKVFMQERIHINQHKVSENKKQKYHFIKSGQKFTGIILCKNEEEASVISELLKDETVYIGGNRGSGYGKCIIKNIRYDENYAEKLIDIKENKNILYISALSDILCLNEKGMPLGYIEESLIAKALKLNNVHLEECTAKETIISGYNGMWRTHLPQYKGIRAGSIFKYSYEGNLDSNLLKEFVLKGIGLRKAEGFGNIMISDSSVLEFNIETEKEIKADKKAADKNILSKAEEKETDFIFNSLLEIKLQRLSEEYIKQILKESSVKSNNNQLGNMLIVIEEMLGKSEKEGKKAFDIYKTHLNEKERINQNAYNQLKNTKIKNQNILEFTEELISNAANPETFSKKYFEIPHFNYMGKKAVVSKEMLYKTSLMMIKNLIKSLLGIRRIENV